MFIFWRATNVPESSEAEHRARMALAALPNVTGIAQGQHFRGAFRVTLYYLSTMNGLDKEPLRQAAEAALRRTFGLDEIQVEEDVEAYTDR